MTIEFGLLLLESVLLVATVILLIYGIHEGKRRDHLLREVGKVHQGPDPSGILFLPGRCHVRRQTGDHRLHHRHPPLR